MIPDWLRDKLASPPQAGAGVHQWLFDVARQLHAHMPPRAVEAALMAATANCGRRLAPHEIPEAVKNSQSCAWKRKDLPSSASAEGTHSEPLPEDAPREAWPKCDPFARSARLKDAEADGVAGVMDLLGASPVRLDEDHGWSVDDWLDWLFPDAEWLCLAKDHPATARSRRRAKWTFGPADQCALIVPSPMTGPSGIAKDGTRSHRCLDNTGPRRWLVVEFDRLADRRSNMPMDEQAALHWHFRAGARAACWPPLRLCVHSGGKSLHGWYGPVVSEDAAFELMAYAATLGADPVTWNRSQLMRLPGGVRVVHDTDDVSLPDGWPAATGRQEVFFFDPQ